MVIRSSNNMNYLLGDIEKKIETLFYSVWFDFRVFTFEKITEEEKSVITFDLDCVMQIFQLEKEVVEKIDPLTEIRLIHLNDAFEKMYTFAEYRGDKDEPDVLQEPDSKTCKDVFKFLCMLVFGSIETINPVCFDIKAPGGAYLAPWIGWGFCLVFVNKEKGWGCLLYADPCF